MALSLGLGAPGVLQGQRSTPASEEIDWTPMGYRMTRRKAQSPLDAFYPSSGPAVSTQYFGGGVDAGGGASGALTRAASTRTVRRTDPQIKSSMLGLLAALKSPVEPPPGPTPMTIEDESAAEQAARTQAGENAGLRLQSSMRGLSNEMSRRGITGSGIHADRMSDLFADSAAEEAGTDRDIIRRRADRSHEISDQNFAAQNAYNQYLGDFRLRERDRLSHLLSYYGMLLPEDMDVLQY